MQGPHGHHDLTWCMAETREREGRARAHPGCTHTRSQSKEELEGTTSEFDEGDKARCTEGTTRASRPDWWMMEKREREGKHEHVMGAPTHGSKSSRELDGHKGSEVKTKRGVVGVHKEKVRYTQIGRQERKNMRGTPGPP